MGIPDEFIEHGDVDLLMRDIDLTAEEAEKRITTLVEKKTKQEGIKA